MRKFEKFVSDGIKLLNEKCPKWRKKIDLKELDLSDRGYCILGQLYGDYHKGLVKLDLLSTDDPLVHDCPLVLGFQISFFDDTQWKRDIKTLQKEWERQL